MNESEFVASEANHWALTRVIVCWHLHISSHFWGWSRRPVLIGKRSFFLFFFQTNEYQLCLWSFTEDIHLQIRPVWIRSCRWQVATQNWRRGGRMQETKETSSDQTTTVQEKTCRHQRKQHTRCIASGGSVLRSLIQNDFSRCKQNKGVRASQCASFVVRLYNWKCEFTYCSLLLTRQIVEKLSIDNFCFDWLAVHPQRKSSKKSENMDVGCLAYWQKYFRVGMSVFAASKTARHQLHISTH